MITRTKVKLGPQHQGRKMSLKAFEFADVEAGYLFELARGYVVVSQVPRYSHAMQIEVARDYLRDHKRDHPGTIHAVLGSMECKFVISDWDSERHPDLAVYLTAPSGPKDRAMWQTWIPELAIEVVSLSSAERDYVQKREEYWALGIKEYWIVDAQAQKVTILKRARSDWSEKELHAGDVCETKLLPGFKLPCQAIFDAAVAAGEDE